MVGGLPKVRWATWIPHGSWKDVFIGDYDYKYLFMVSFNTTREMWVLLQESGALGPCCVLTECTFCLPAVDNFYPVACCLSLPCLVAAQMALLQKGYHRQAATFLCCQ